MYEELLSAVRVSIVTGEDSVAASVAAKESDDIDIDTTPNMTLTGEEQEEFEATFE